MKFSYWLWIFVSLMTLGQTAEARDHRVSLQINGHAIRAEVARTPDERAQGLMNRRHMGKNDGMLFVFEQAQPVSMWMKNTLLPLSVAFIDEQGRIINIAEMLPETLDSHSSLAPAKYALEMNAGWFDQHGILAGKLVEGIDAALNKNPVTKPARPSLR